MKPIKFYKKNVYGNMLCYFAKESQKEASAFMLMTGRITINTSDMKALRVLGFELVEVLPE